MQGRLENEMKLNQTTEEIIKGLPPYVNEWYTNMKASRKTASSCQVYARKIRKFLEYINDNPKDVTPDDITLQSCESFLISCQTKTNDKGMIVYTSDSYQQGMWCALNSLLKFLNKRNYITYNYMEDIDRPKNKDFDRINNERVLLTQRDFNKILNAAKNEDGIFGNRDVLIILLFMFTGMRRTALSEINVSDINYNEYLLTVIDKGNKTHSYHLNEQIIKYVKLWIQDRKKIVGSLNEDALFVNKFGSRISSHSIGDIVKKYCYIGVGKKLSPHKIRAGFCSILYNQTHDIEFVRRVVGHSNIQTTQRYIKTDDKEKSKAVEIMDSLIKC